MQNKNIIIIISIAVVALVFWKFIGFEQNTLNLPETSAVPTETLIISTTTPITTKPTDEKTDTINKAWAVFQNYLTAAKNHDLETLTKLSYQLSDTCKDSKQTKGCNSLMDNASWFGGEMKKADYTNVWYDNKQIILFTNEVLYATSTNRGLYRGFIYFTKNDKGEIKFLSLNPAIGAFELTKDKTNEQVDADVMVMVKDTDEDGLADTLETCEKDVDSTICKKTDPNKRDTNGNGWWDGIEALFYIKL